MKDAMDETTARLLQYIMYKGYSDYRVATDCGISGGLIGKFRSGKSSAGRTSLEKVLETYPELSREWLLYGRGAMLNEGAEELEPVTEFEVTDGTTARLLEYIRYKGYSDSRVIIDCGLSGGIIGKFRSGKSRAGRNTVNKILKTYTELNEEWLYRGRGEMLKESESSSVNVMQGNVLNGSAVAQGVKSSASVTLPHDARWLEELRAQREITQTCQQQLTESQSQVSRLLGIIEKLS